MPWLQQSLAFSANFFRLIRSVSGWNLGLGRHWWFRKLLLLNSASGKRKPISPVLEQELADFYCEDVQKLSRLLNRDLAHWISGPCGAAQRGFKEPLVT